MPEVESALVQYLQEFVLTEESFDMVRAEIARQVEAQIPRPEVSVDDIEGMLSQLRAEQRKLAKAVALSDDIPELVAELERRSARIRALEQQLEAAARAPEEIAGIIRGAQETAVGKPQNLQEALSRREDLRDVFLTLFPEGLTFTPAWVENRSRRVWQVEGFARLGGVPID